jgi:RHS repeat-associated protein
MRNDRSLLSVWWRRGAPRPLTRHLLWALPVAVTVAAVGVAPAEIAQPAAAATAAKPVCPAELADENAALVTARSCGKPVAISGLTTEMDQAVATPTGVVQWQHHYRPVRVRSGGTWAPVDTTLQVQADGTVASTAAALRMSFSGGGKGPMVTVTQDGKSFALDAPFGSLPTPVIEGSTATYSDVLPGVDLQLTADVDGYTQVLVVKDRQAASNPKLARLAFATSGNGMTATADKAGNLHVSDSKGKLLLSGNTPLMWDAAGAAGKAGRTKAMAATVAGNVLSVTPDAAMLTDPATVFPVSIDPGVTLNRSSWAMVDSATPTTAYWNSAGGAQVGTSNAGASVKRSFFNVDLASSPVAGKYVTAASVNLDLNSSASCTARQVDLYTTAAATSATTWNNQPTWTALQSSQTVAKGFDATCPAGSISMDASAGVRDAVTAGTSTLTLGVRATSETDNSYAKTFGNNPTLTVSYTAYPTVTELMTAPSTPCQTGTNRPYLNTTTPLLQARITDPEGAVVRPEFSFSTTGGTSLGDAQPTPGTASGQMQGTTVPSGAFSNGGSYSWKVRGFDGTVWGPWSTSCEFTVDTTVPTTAPTVSSTTYPAGTWAGATGTAGSFTLGAAGISDIAAYVYGLDTDPNTSVNAASLGASATISITPTADGPHTLKVQSRDRGGNLSPVTSYIFNVGTGAVTAPITGTQTAAKVTLSGISKTTSSGITYQWRRGDTDTWTTIPAADVTTTTGSAITWPIATSGSGAYPNLVWNVAQTVNNAEPGAAALDGPLQVRASLSGTSSGTSTGVAFTLDQNKTDAATTTVGPGEVNLLTGNYTIGASDASSIGGLGLNRTFNTRQASTIDAMFGPGWTSSVAAPASGTYTQLSVTGSLVQVGKADGSTLGFTKSATTSGGATFTAEVGAGNTQLTYTSSSDTYTLTEASGDTVNFTRRTGDPAGLYTPTSLQAAGTSAASTISWQKVTLASGDVVRPTQILAPAPSGISCTTLVKGCRALTFTYATTTTATSSTPGDYTGRLTQVALTAWDPDLGTPAMRTITLQQYTYDSTGRLAQAWDPRLDYTSGGSTLHVTTAYTYNGDNTLATLTPPGEQAWSFTYTTLPTDPGAGRLYKVTRSALSAGTSVQTIVYNIPISGGSAPFDMAANIARWGQTAVPVDATSVYPGDIVPDGNPATGTLPSNTTDDRVTVHYMDPNGRETNTMQPGGAIDATFYDNYGNISQQTIAANITRALYASSTDTPAQEAVLARSESTLATYSGDGQRLLETLAPEQDTVLTDWSTVRGRTHTVYTYDENAPTGGPYNLVTTQVESLQFVVSGATTDTDKRTTTTTYDWNLRQPLTQTVDPNGLALVSRTSYDSTTGQATAVTTPAGNSAGTTPSTRKVTYYRSGTGSGSSDCDNHPEWALLPCLTSVGGQPSSGNEIPSTQTTYDLYGQTRTVAEKNSTTTLRTTTITYDAAGRRSDVTVNSSLGTAVAKQHSVYAQATGYLTGTQSLDASNNVTASISGGYDTLGRSTSYTDADGNTSTTSYDLLSRPATSNDGKGTQTFTYNGSGEKRGLPTQVVDSQAGTITGSYGVDGNLQTETRPDGITVRHYYNENGQPTGLEYVTDPACNSASCTLYYDYTGSDGHSKIRWDSSSFSNGGYGYDNAGRLTGASQDTTTSCALRAYTFNNASDRTQLTSYGPDANGNCNDGNPATNQTWTYDEADRVTNTGYTYDALGRTLTTPGADTIGGASAGAVSNTYYANDLARTITQGTTTTTYSLDPTALRFRSYSTVANGSTVSHTNHYSDESDSPTWISEGTWYTRVIPGLTGVAAQYTGASPQLVWQVTNLHGDIVATRVAGSAGISTTNVTDEYGRPAATSTPRYGYLGDSQRSADNPGGLITMGVRLYNPSTGRFLTTDPVYGGGANAYAYPSDPIDGRDTDGRLWQWQRMAIAGAVFFAIDILVKAFCNVNLICTLLLGAVVGAVATVVDEKWVDPQKICIGCIAVGAVIGALNAVGGGEVVIKRFPGFSAAIGKVGAWTIARIGSRIPALAGLLAALMSAILNGINSRRK